MMKLFLHNKFINPLLCFLFFFIIRSEGYICNDLDLKIYFIPINRPHHQPQHQYPFKIFYKFA